METAGDRKAQQRAERMGIQSWRGKGGWRSRRKRRLQRAREAYRTYEIDRMVQADWESFDWRWIQYVDSMFAHVPIIASDDQ